MRGEAVRQRQYEGAHNEAVREEQQRGRNSSEGGAAVREEQQ